MVVIVVGAAVFRTVSDGAAAVVTDAVDGALITAGPVGGVPDTVAEFCTEPASKSLAVTT